MKYRRMKNSWLYYLYFLGGNKLKKVLLIGTVSVLLLIPGVKILAEEEKVKGEGVIEGIINFYDDDIKYLKDEINRLLEECREKVNYE